MLEVLISGTRLKFKEVLIDILGIVVVEVVVVVVV
jgi:hypothetical protein